MNSILFYLQIFSSVVMGSQMVNFYSRYLNTKDSDILVMILAGIVTALALNAYVLKEVYANEKEKFNKILFLNVGIIVLMWIIPAIYNISWTRFIANASMIVLNYIFAKKYIGPALDNYGNAMK